MKTHDFKCSLPSDRAGRPAGARSRAAALMLLTALGLAVTLSACQDYVPMDKISARGQANVYSGLDY